MLRYDLIQTLVESGVLSAELCPRPNHWHWDVLQPEHLPEELKSDFQQYGEIRWYGN